MVFNTQDLISPPETQYISRREHLRAESWATPIFGGWDMRKNQHQGWRRSLNQENVGPGSQGKKCFKGGSDQQCQLADRWQFKKDEDYELTIGLTIGRSLILTEWCNFRDGKEILSNGLKEKVRRIGDSKYGQLFQEFLLQRRQKQKMRAITACMDMHML